MRSWNEFSALIEEWEGLRGLLDRHRSVWLDLGAGRVGQTPAGRRNDWLKDD